MRSLRFALVLVASCLVAADARALPPMGLTPIDQSRTADFWRELTRGPFSAPPDAVLTPKVNLFDRMPRLGSARATRGFYLFGTDALHVVPRRIGFWGWGLVAGGEF